MFGLLARWNALEERCLQRRRDVARVQVVMPELIPALAAALESGQANRPAVSMLLVVGAAGDVEHVQIAVTVEVGDGRAVTAREQRLIVDGGSVELVEKLSIVAPNHAQNALAVAEAQIELPVAIEVGDRHAACDAPSMLKCRESLAVGHRAVSAQDVHLVAGGDDLRLAVGIEISNGSRRHDVLVTSPSHPLQLA